MIWGERGLDAGPSRDQPRPFGSKALAAAYLRVSTEQQKYSLKDQSSRVAAYARSHGYRIVKRYVDAGKSGLRLKSRPGLRQLLNDVVSHQRKFGTVLVYSVNRWGRFQDLDEASHYEFLCREAGVELRYCDENFPNDGLPSNFIYKTINRALAAEYSRQLSQEVYLALKRTAESGFRAGGPAGYGLSRVLISTDSKEQIILHRGDMKTLRGQRVAYAWGPQNQIECVRRIFSYAIRRRTTAWIAAEINSEGIPWLEGKPWNPTRVRNVLENELFAGYFVWGRSSRKLKGPRIWLPPSHWTVTENVLPALVDRLQFDKVQELIRPARRLSNEDLLQKLKVLLQRKGKLSVGIITHSTSVPSIGMIYRRFGSLLAAYEQIGYRPTEPDFQQIKLVEGLRFRRQLTERILSTFPNRMTRTKQIGSGSYCPVLLVDGKILLTLRVCRQRLIDGKRKWTLKSSLSQNSDVSLLCLLNKAGDAVAAYYLFPSLPLRNGTRFTFNGRFLAKGQRLSTLEGLAESVTNFAINSFPSVS